MKIFVKELMNTDSYANGIHLLNLIKNNFWAVMILIEWFDLHPSIKSIIIWPGDEECVQRVISCRMKVITTGAWAIFYTLSLSIIMCEPWL